MWLQKSYFSRLRTDKDASSNEAIVEDRGKAEQLLSRAKKIGHYRSGERSLG